MAVFEVATAPIAEHCHVFRRSAWVCAGTPSQIFMAATPLSRVADLLGRALRALGDEPLGPARGGYELAGWRTGT